MLVLVAVGVFAAPGTPATAAAAVGGAADVEVDVSPSGAPEVGFSWVEGAAAELG